MTKPATELGLGLPNWLEELESSLRFHSQFVMAGNIRDQFIVPEAGGGTGISSVAAIWYVLQRRGCTWLATYDTVDQLVLRYQEEGCVLPSSRELGAFDANGRLALNDSQLRGWIRSVQQPSPAQTSGALVVDFASRLARPLDGPNPELNALFNLAEKASYNATPATRRESDGLALPFNPIIWLVDNASDLPDSIRVGNERVRTIMVGLPDRQTRKFIAESLARSLRARHGLSDEQAQRFTQQFVLLTEGMKLSSIMQINQVVAMDANHESAEMDPVQRFASAIRAFRVGSTRDPWRDSTVHQSIRTGFEQVSREVKGQDFAIHGSLDILKRSVTGLSGAQVGRSGGRPRGVLFFAGPTGVGKTELAKQITKLLFGDESAYHRFDMSEFAQEHSEARLIGAPPGYVGHDAGGELVNAIRSRPFSVLLFDEIEKAHPRILDKFLQILEDGRLTDGRGDTVYFSESVIIFTSNLGIYKEVLHDGQLVRVPNVTAESATDRCEVERVVIEEIQDYFRSRIQRPELLNRIGKNIIVFDFVRPDVSIEIMDKMLTNVKQRVLEEHRISIEFSTDSRNSLEALCLSEASINGGRGVGNALENALINPLARALFDILPLEGQSQVCVEAITEHEGRWELRLGPT